MGDIRYRMPHVAHLPRTGHDMSQSFGFTASTGMILPVYQDFLNVGETVYLNGEFFGRTQPLVTCAMADVDFYLDWFFVPFSLLYSLWPSLRYQTNDYFSSNFTAEVTQHGLTLPLTDIQSMLDQLDDSGTAGAITRASSTTAFGYGGHNVNFDCCGKSVYRLLNHFGFNPDGVFHSNAGTGAGSCQNPSVFPLFPLAYQAIFQDYYRDDDYERRNPLCCNADKYHTWQTTLDQFGLTSGLFLLRYRSRHKDYFLDVKPSPIMSGMNLLDLDNTQVSQTLNSITSYLDTFSTKPSSDARGETNFSGGTNNMLFTQMINSFTSTAGGSANRISTNSIRNLFAVEKLLRITGRARKDYDSQVLAHFGFKVPNDVKHQISHILTQHGLLHIGEVVSNSDTYSAASGSTPSKGAALGSISGKGYINIKSLSRSKKFTAPVDGVLMCCFSSAPRVRYYQTFDKLNSITSRLDFYTPEFDKLGMQPLFVYETDIREVGTAKRLGWQYRYSQFKRKYDRVTEAFRLGSNDQNQYSSWVLAQNPLKFISQYGTTSYYQPSISSIYVSPKDLDNIMVVKYSTGWSSSYTNLQPYLMFGTDPFICDFRARVKKVSTMSTYGEPEL